MGDLLTWELLNPDLPMTPSQWADAHRMLSGLTSAEPGRWSTSRTPYLREPLNSFTTPGVSEIIIQSSTQVGKTEFILNCLGYIVDYDPAPTMIVLPRDDDARGWATKRVKPMLELSPRLSQHLTGKDDDLAGKLYQLDQMFIKFAGANSPADLASDPCRYVFFDEVNKYPRFSGREADPVKLGMERTRTFWNRKIIKVSTPTTTTGYITRDYERSDKRRFYVPCPLCGAYQPLVFRRQEGAGCGQLCWPNDMTAERIRRTRTVWYECGYCHKQIEEFQKGRIVERGVWCPEGCEVNVIGEVVGSPQVDSVRGYHLSALCSPWVSWTEIVAEFLETKAYPSLLMNFVNSVLGEPWKEKTAETTSVHLLQRVGAHAFGEVPAGVRVLTAGVDVQKDHFYFVIRGWGVGEESWLIRYGRVEDPAELLHVLLYTQYPTHGGGAMMVRLGCIDSGYRTNEIYTLCREHREVLRPTKGYDHVMAAPQRASLLDRNSVGAPIQGGLTLWSLDTTYYKDKLNRLMHTEPGNPGEWHLCLEPSAEYVDHMLSEEKVIDRNRTTGVIVERWQQKSENRANHLLDCEVLALAAADMLKVFMLREGTQTVTYQPPRASWVNPNARVGEPAQVGRWLRR